MAINRTMGTETEYGIMGGLATDVLRGYAGRKKEQYNAGKTNESAVQGFHDIGGHDGGDYQTLAEQLSEANPSLIDNIGKKAAEFGRKVKNATRNFVDSYQDTGDMISNGSRFYIDMGHPEYSTAEASNPRELVVLDKVGEWIVAESAKNASEKIKIYKNNTDGKGNSYGCHENYLLQRLTSESFQSDLTSAIIPFFITRQIFTGSGKIGVEKEARNSYSYRYNYGLGLEKETEQESGLSQSYKRQVEKTLEEIEALGKHFLDMGEDYASIEKVLKTLLIKREQSGPQQVYQLSQRADFFSQIIGLGTTTDRPIMNTRDEPHADKKKYMRLHVINGDANMSEVATYLKVGTTALVLDMFEDGLIPKFDVLNPVKQFQNVSLDQSRKWIVELKDGKTLSAVDMQRAFLEVASKNYSGRDSVTDDVLTRWNYTLNALETDPMKLFGQVDWVTKLGLVTKIAGNKGLKLTDPVILNAALQYHDTNRTQGLFYLLQNKGMIERITSDQEITSMLYEPPSTTRAFLRGKATELDSVNKVDWGEFEIKTKKNTFVVTMNEPFVGTKEQVENILKLESPEKIVEALKTMEGISCEKKTFYRSPSTYQPRSTFNPRSGRFDIPTEDVWTKYLGRFPGEEFEK